jgi:protein arginine N-methyltransferase 1
MNLGSFSAGARLLRYHASLLQDRERLRAYSQVIADLVRQGDVVLDIGTGTGILAFLAARSGARTVYAIERGPAIELARAIALGGPAGDPVVFLEGRSTNIDLPERVDVIVTETLWNFGVGEGLLGTVVDARDRFLNEGGTIVPKTLELQCSLVERPDIYRDFVDSWGERIGDVDFSPLRTFAANNVYVAAFTHADLLSEPVALAKVSLLETKEADVRAEVTCRVTRSGTAHGIAGWFRADLSDRVALSNAPPLSTSNWDHAFLPLAEPIDLEAESSVRIAVATSADGAHWSWEVEVGGRTRANGRTPSSHQSTLFGLPMSSLEKLRRRGGTYCPQASRESEAAAFVLSAFDGKTTIQRMQQELRRSYADVFRSDEQAGAFVRDIVAAANPADG